MSLQQTRHRVPDIPGRGIHRLGDYGIWVSKVFPKTRNLNTQQNQKAAFHLLFVLQLSMGKLDLPPTKLFSKGT
jgi:hypothetical protein